MSFSTRNIYQNQSAGKWVVLYPYIDYYRQAFTQCHPLQKSILNALMTKYEYICDTLPKQYNLFTELSFYVRVLYVFHCIVGKLAGGGSVAVAATGDR